MKEIDNKYQFMILAVRRDNFPTADNEGISEILKCVRKQIDKQNNKALLPHPARETQSLPQLTAKRKQNKRKQQQHAVA